MSVKRFVLAAPLGLMMTACAAAADLTVQVTGIAGPSGLVRVAACTEAEFLRTCRLVASAPARAGTLAVTLRSVPPGRYALQAHHDSDGDGRIARNIVGIPSEGVGFSRDASMRFGPPSFADAAIEVGERPSTIRIALRFGPAS